MRTVDILGYSISASGLSGDIAMAWDILKSSTSGNYMAYLNPHSLVEARNNSQFRKALSEADILVPDGVGIVLAAKLLGLDLHERVAGHDFFQSLPGRQKTVMVSGISFWDPQMKYWKRLSIK